MEYPKIETLYDRDPKTFRVLTDKMRLPEFAAVKLWRVSEKIDGTNIRVSFVRGGAIVFGGRTDNASIPAPLVDYLRRTFTDERVRNAFPLDLSKPDTDLIVLYGEGYGPKIQKGGGDYRGDPSFRLFDVSIGGMWLAHESVADIADKLGVKTVPDFGVMSMETALLLVNELSRCAAEDGGSASKIHEGIVARSEPLMLTRRGQRIMWKLKGRDFVGGKQ